MKRVLKMAARRWAISFFVVHYHWVRHERDRLLAENQRFRLVLQRDHRRFVVIRDSNGINSARVWDQATSGRRETAAALGLDQKRQV